MFESLLLRQEPTFQKDVGSFCFYKFNTKIIVFLLKFKNYKIFLPISETRSKAVSHPKKERLTREKRQIYERITSKERGDDMPRSFNA